MTHPFTCRQFVIYGLLALGVSFLLKTFDPSISPPAASTVKSSSSHIPSAIPVK